MGGTTGRMSENESAPSLSLSESCSRHIFCLSIDFFFFFWFAFESLIRGMPYDSLTCFVLSHGCVLFFVWEISMTSGYVDREVLIIGKVVGWSIGVPKGLPCVEYI